MTRGRCGGLHTRQPTGGRTLISGARDNTLRLWNAATCTTVREIFDRKQGVNGKHRADVRRAVVLPDAPQGSGQPPRRSLLTASMDGTLRVWQLAPDDAGGASSKGTAGSRPGEPTASGRGAASDAEADLLLLSEADAAAAAGGGGAGSAAGATRRQPPSAAVSLDALDVGAGWDDTTKSLLIEILAGKGAVDVAVDEAGHDLCLASLSFFERDVGVSSLALNPNPARPIVAVSSSAHTLALLALRTDTLPWLTRQAEGTLPAGVLPPGTDLAPLSLVQTFAGHEGAVTGVALLPDEATLVSVGADSRVSVYDVATVDRRLSLSFGTSALCVSLAPSTVASASSSAFVFVGGADYVIRAYSADPADYAALTAAYAALPVPQPVARHDYEAARYVGHAGRVETIAIHPNGRIMASGGRDWSVLLWSLVKPALTLSVRLRAWGGGGERASTRRLRRVPPLVAAHCVALASRRV